MKNQKRKLHAIAAIVAAMLFVFCDSDTDTKPVQVKDLELTSPRGGEVFKIGDTVYIAWKADTTKIGKVYFRVSTDNGKQWNRTVSRTSVDAAKGAFDWKVGSESDPVTTYPSDQCLLKILDYSDDQINDVSGVFSVIN